MRYDPDAAIRYYRALTLPALRKRQSICEAQIGAAFNQRNTSTLVRLQLVADTLSAAVMEKCP